MCPDRLSFNNRHQGWLLPIYQGHGVLGDFGIKVSQGGDLIFGAGIAAVALPLLYSMAVLDGEVPLYTCRDTNNCASSTETAVDLAITAIPIGAALTATGLGLWATGNAIGFAADKCFSKNRG